MAFPFLVRNFYPPGSGGAYFFVSRLATIQKGNEKTLTQGNPVRNTELTYAGHQNYSVQLTGTTSYTDLADLFAAL